MNSIKNNNYYYLPKTTTEESATIEEKKMDDATNVDGIEVAIKMWDDHIERLEAKLLFLIRLCDDHNSDLLHQCEKKVVTLEREINDAMEQRQMLIGRGKLVLLSNR